MWGTLPHEHAVYPDLLETLGYVVGSTGKGWGPGTVPGGRAQAQPGRAAVHRASTTSCEQRPAGTPFCFWFGSTDPHRPYEPGTGAQAGARRRSVRGAGFPPRYAGGARRPARLLLRSRAIRSRAWRHLRARSSAPASSTTRSSSSRLTTACHFRAPRRRCTTPARGCHSRSAGRAWRTPA